jgi:hypothetical protein
VDEFVTYVSDVRYSKGFEMENSQQWRNTSLAKFPSLGELRKNIDVG